MIKFPRYSSKVKAMWKGPWWKIGREIGALKRKIFACFPNLISYDDISQLKLPLVSQVIILSFLRC